MRMTVPRLGFFLGLFLTGSFLSILPPASRADAQAETKRASSGLTAAPTETTAFRWKLDREHRFLWLHRREKIGETRFLVKLVPFPGRPGERLVEVRATRSYHRESVVQEATGTTHVTFTGVPEHYEERLTVLHASTARRSTQVTTLERRGGTTRVSFVQNGRKDQPSVDERVLAAGTFLCASQAIEHWAIFVSSLPKKFARREVKLYYPDQRKVITVQLNGKGEETIKIGKSKVAARRYSFRSAKGELDGNIWIGAEGRLLQITFPQTQVRVVLATV